MMSDNDEEGSNIYYIVKLDANENRVYLSDLGDEVQNPRVSEQNFRNILEKLQLQLSGHQGNIIDNVHHKVLSLAELNPSHHKNNVNGKITSDTERMAGESHYDIVNVVSLEGIINDWEFVKVSTKKRVKSLLTKAKRLDEDLNDDFDFSMVRNYTSIHEFMLKHLNPRPLTKLTSFFIRRDFNADSQNDFNSQLLNTQYSERNSIQDSDSNLFPSDLEKGLQVPSQFYESSSPQQIDENELPEDIEHSSSSLDEVPDNIRSNQIKRSLTDTTDYIGTKTRRLHPKNTIKTDKWDSSFFLFEKNKHQKFILQPCKLLNMSPAFFRDYSEFKDKELKLYFQKINSQEPYNLPNMNCLEVIIKNDKNYLDCFGKLINNSSKLRHFLKGNLSLTIQRESFLCSDYKLLSWKIDNIEFVFENNEITKDKNDKEGGVIGNSIDISNIEFTDETSRDQVIQFKDMIFEEENSPKFYIMYGYLLSCSTENSNYANFVFTDFSKNSRYEQKYTFDRYIHEYSNKLEHDEGFRVISYYNHYEQFNEQIRSRYGKDLNDMVQENNNLGDKNVSKYGILCRLVVKTKLYQSTLNIVERDIQLVSDLRSVTEAERPVLETVVDKMQKSISISTVPNRRAENNTSITNATRAMCTSTSTCTSTSSQGPLPPAKEIDISLYEIREIHSITTMINCNPIEDKFIFVIMLTIISVEVVNDTHIRLRLTDQNHNTSASSQLERPSIVYPDQVIDVDIIGHKEVNSFLGDEPMTKDLLQPLLNEELRFKLIRQISAATYMVRWAPVECTVQELKLQRMLKLHRTIKQEM